MCKLEKFSTIHGQSRKKRYMLILKRKCQPHIINLSLCVSVIMDCHCIVGPLLHKQNILRVIEFNLRLHSHRMRHALQRFQRNMSHLINYLFLISHICFTSSYHPTFNVWKIIHTQTYIHVYVQGCKIIQSKPK